jgi:O-acetylhomoserine (thiol)-lyase
MKDNAMPKQGFETLSVHSGPGPDATGASNPAIYQSSSFVFRDTQHAADVFALKESGYIYSRLTNPTVSALEQKITALEGGAGATCTASGLAANVLAFSALLKSGDEFVSTQKLYGGSAGQFRDTFQHSFGWKCLFTDPMKPDEFKRKITDRTRLIFIESLSNPEGVIPDIEAFAKIAEDAGIPLIVDNTVATPYLCRPFEYGANIIVHSTTKYFSGHGQSMGGAVVDGGNFNWMKNAAKFPLLTQEDSSYRDTIFARDFKDAPFALFNHAVGLRNLGMNQQAMNAWLTVVGMETLPLRMRQHCENAHKVAEFLSRHKAVAWVSYPGLPSSPFHAMAKKYMRNGWASGLFTFGLKNGYNAGVKLVENVKLFYHLANIGDTRSLIIHPASTTHAQLTDEQKISAGCGPEVIRVSIGIETAEDLIADLDQALDQALAHAA